MNNQVRIKRSNNCKTGVQKKTKVKTEKKKLLEKFK